MTFGNVEQNFAISTSKLFDSAFLWWSTFRPKGFTLLQHLENPHINMRRKKDKELATEIAAILRNEVLE